MEKRISGHTGLMGLFGSPVGHSGSPAMYNFSFQHDGLDYSRHMYVQELVWIIVRRVQIKVLPE